MYCYGLFVCNVAIKHVDIQLPSSTYPLHVNLYLPSTLPNHHSTMCQTAQPSPLAMLFCDKDYRDISRLIVSKLYVKRTIEIADFSYVDSLAFYLVSAISHEEQYHMLHEAYSEESETLRDILKDILLKSNEYSNAKAFIMNHTASTISSVYHCPIPLVCKAFLFNWPCIKPSSISPHTVYYDVRSFIRSISMVYDQYITEHGSSVSRVIAYGFGQYDTAKLVNQMRSNHTSKLNKYIQSVPLLNSIKRHIEQGGSLWLTRDQIHKLQKEASEDQTVKE